MTDLRDMYLDAATRPPTPDGRIGITVHGTPIPQGSKTANRFGHGVRDANPERLKPWRAAVTAQAADNCRYVDTITGPVRLYARFTFDRPRKHWRTGRNAHLLTDTAPAYPGRLQGDLDKLIRAVCDSLTDAKVWDDDTQVVDIRARKFWAGEHEYALKAAGVQLLVEPLEAGALW